jgi:hypothetical protein
MSAGSDNGFNLNDGVTYFQKVLEGPCWIEMLGRCQRVGANTLYDATFRHEQFLLRYSQPHLILSK